MTDPMICIVDLDLPKNEDFYKRLLVETANLGIAVRYVKTPNQAPQESSILLLAAPISVQDVDPDKVVLGLRSINRKERMQIAEKILPENYIARWSSPKSEDALQAVVSGWGRDQYIFKYDWSAGRRGVKLFDREKDCLPSDYNSTRDVIMEYLDDDPYTYKADLCGGLLLNAWFLRTVDIADDNFHDYTKNPTAFTLPSVVQGALEKLSRELMRYGSGYISIDMMKKNGEFKIIEINTNCVGRNIPWERFGETYLETYPKGLEKLLANRSSLPTLAEVTELESRTNKILPPEDIRS